MNQESNTTARRGRAFGLERAMDTCGAILAPGAAWLLLGWGVSQRTLIAWSFVPALLAVLAIVCLVRERTDREPITTPFLRSFRGFDRAYKEFLTGVGLFGIGDFADTFYILYATTILTPKLSTAQAASLSVGFYVLHNVFYASWSYGGGWLADHANRRLLLTCGYVCAALAAVCMLVGVDSYIGLALMFALGGTGVGIYEAVEDTIAAELLPREIRGSGFGLLAVVTGLGDFVSSLLVGYVWSVSGVRAAMGCAIVPMLAGAGLVAHLAMRRNGQARTVSP